MSTALLPTVLNGPGLEIPMHLVSSTDVSTDARLLKEIIRRAGRHAEKLMSADAAEDIAQDVVLECLTRMREGKWRIRRSLPALVRKMVRRRLTDHLRGQESRVTHEEEHVRERTESIHAWMSPELALQERELERFHEETLASLPRACRRAYVMVREEGTPYGVAADRLGVSRAAVNSHVVAAQRRFRTELLDKRIATPPPARARPQADRNGEARSIGRAEAPPGDSTECPTGSSTRSTR
jgi:RNA polymerase sigma factor (sigma-70 family)